DSDASTYTGTTTFRACNGVCTTYFTSIADLGLPSALGAPSTVENGTIVFNQSSQYRDYLVYLGTGHSSNRNWSLNGASAIIANQGSGTLTLTGTITSNGGGVFEADSADMELLGELAGNANFTFRGNAGRQVRLGSASTYTGTTSIDTVTVVAPVLAVAGAPSSFGSGSTISMTNGTVSYTGSGGVTDRAWTSQGSTAIRNDGSGALGLSGPLSFLAGNPADVLTLGGSYAGESTFSGPISGIGDLVVDGAGTWVLDGANTHTGRGRVENGTLRVGSAEALGTTTHVDVNGGTLDLDGFELQAQSLAGDGTVALGAGTLTLNAASGGAAPVFGGSITGSGGLTKLGTSTQVLSGANAYTGATTIGGGVLRLDFSAAGGPASDILASASTLNMTGGTLAVTGAAGENNEQTLNGVI